MTARLETCALCPKLCRDVCPVGVATGRERATPTGMAFLAWVAETGRAEGVDAAEAASWCVGCGACEAHCGVAQPLPELLRQVRARAEPTAVEAVGVIEGEGEIVAVLCGEARWAEALSRARGQPVASLRTGDFLGEALLDWPDAFEEHAIALRRVVGARTMVVASARAARAARAAGLDVVELHRWFAPLDSSLRRLPVCGEVDLGRGWLACCGGRGVLERHATESAEAMARTQALRLGGEVVYLDDPRCASRLRRFGAVVRDPLLELMEVHGGEIPE